MIIQSIEIKAKTSGWKQKGGSESLK